ncbi:MAG: hypothetical protein Q7K55_08615 [Candidatus Levybacteria bacterium]|nr:hypothetical protein [Candidatus Levybacteria bacterium]
MRNVLNWSSNLFRHRSLQNSTQNLHTDNQLNINRKENRFKKINFRIPKDKFMTIVLFFVLMTFSFLMGGKFTQGAPTVEDRRSDAPIAKAKQSLNKGFTFPLNNEKGQEVSKIKYDIESAELQDQILVKGQRATAVKGRTFLILNIKITNKHNQGITLNSRDYIRLLINNQKELLAPDIHNDPVQIQAISTKYTRLGFPINEDYKNLKLQIGEIGGKKEDIILNLK